MVGEGRQAGRNQASSVPSTADLIDGARSGDESAREELAGRIGKLLRRWGHGKLPDWARHGSTTADVAQDVTLKVLQRLLDPEQEPPGAPRGFLRKALQYDICDRIRWAKRRPREKLDDGDTRPAPGPAPEGEYVERLALEEARGRLRECMARLDKRDRRLIELHLEERPFAETAAALGLPTADAARMAYNRAFARLRRLVLEASEGVGRGGPRSRDEKPGGAPRRELG